MATADVACAGVNCSPFGCLMLSHTVIFSPLASKQLVNTAAVAGRGQLVCLHSAGLVSVSTTIVSDGKEGNADNTPALQSYAEA